MQFGFKMASKQANLLLFTCDQMLPMSFLVGPILFLENLIAGLKFGDHRRKNGI
jgi:hypothetical protein